MEKERKKCKINRILATGTNRDESIDLRLMKKIAVIGPESTGKSTLCTQLAGYFKSDWIPEYARAYLLANGTNYTYKDLLIIAKGQAAHETHYLQASAGRQSPATTNDTPQGSTINEEPLLFLDTEMYVLKVWCEFVFGDCHLWILDEIVKNRYDLYLLCNIDLPWVKDELREYPDFSSREKLYHIYKDILVNQPVPWVDVHGNYSERLQRGIEGVKRFLM